jgi:hypothetical protein
MTARNHVIHGAIEMLGSANAWQLQGSSDKYRDQRHRGALAILVATAMLPCIPAHADDPCVESDREAARVVSALQRFDHKIANDGVFQVRKIGVGGPLPSDAPRFDVSYHVRGQVVFQQQILSPPSLVADELAINPLRMKDGAKLGVKYLMGAGGRLSCAYRVYDTGGHFHAKRGSW